MPASFETEALKAQAIASRTYAIFKMQNNSKEFDIVTDVSDQSYITVEEMKKKWGNDYQEYYNKINDACNVKEKKNEPHKKYLKYIIVYDWSYDDESGTRIIEKDTLEAIKKEFEKITVIERQFAQDRKLEIFEDNPIYFEAGNPNNYREEHIKVEIKKLLQD